jgi:triosephosphate isomerase
MSRKKIVAGNWKMNLNWADALDLTNHINESSKSIVGVEKIIFPPFPFLHGINEVLKNNKDFFVGAQNCSEHAKGAYTGEVSAEMIISTGCSYVLIGHSERRQYFQENSVQLVSKINRALENGLKIVFCFGEQLTERKNNSHFETVKEQLLEVLSRFSPWQMEYFILAYEPVWAIGTGETATKEQAQEMHAFVRKTVAEIFDDKTANEISILYGGSCNAQNAQDLFSCADVDGGLIGGASLKAEDFCKIMNSFS